ncbi:MAG: AI-2E family transporter [Wenyingzhuangia sp.]|uniref:AI-2E family transporter n=1 Tax=Wenyingzhuangia sp. TaxID=1964193 RepID=UPI00321A7312
MTAKIISNGILRTIAILAGLAGLTWFVLQIQTVIIYIIISAILALISRPFIRFFKQKLKFNNSLSVITTILIYTVLIVILVNLFAPLISKQSENIALLNSEEFKGNIEKLRKEVNDYLILNHIDVLEKTQNIDFLPGIKNIPNVINFILSKLGSFSIGLFSVLFITFFFMLEAKILSKATLVLTPKKHLLHVVRSIETIKDLLSRYFIGLIIQISILFVIYTSLLTIFEIENPIIIAFLCASLNLIPYLGPMMGGVIMFILTTTNNLDLDFRTEILPNTLYIMAGYTIAQLIDNFISQPIIFSRSIKSHPLEIFIVILVFGNLFGVLGMVISIPAYTAIKVIAKEFFNKYKAIKLLTKDF